MKLIVLGAGGFVGGWICEEAWSRGRVELVACVRRWASAVRLARRGIPIALADIQDTKELTSLIAGADVVVNASMPPPTQEPDLAAQLYATCAEAGVRRLIQFSSVAVYGDQAGEVSEASPPKPGDNYARGKVEMEKRLRQVAQQGGPQLVILRPSIIYGPFSESWTVRVAQRIANSRWSGFGLAGSGTCNLIHSHDVARAVFYAATADIPDGVDVFNLNGSEVLTWNDYLKRFGDALGIPDRFDPNPLAFYAAALAVEPMRIGGRWAMSHFNEAVMNVYQSGGSVRDVMKRVESLIKLYPSLGEMKLLGLKSQYSATLAADVLGFRPTMSLDDGLKQSACWCRTHGVL